MASARAHYAPESDERANAPALEIPSISLWGILVFLVRDFGFYVVVSAALGMIVGGTVLGIAGGWLGLQLAEAWTSGPGTVMKIGGYLVLTLITFFYVAAGFVQGLIVSVISFVLRQTDTVEAKLHEFLEPMTRSLAARIPFGQEGIPVEAFRDVFDPIVEKLHAEARPRGFSVFSAGNAVVRFAFRLLLRGVRWAVDEFFVEELQKDGVTHINVTQLEVFAREKLTGLVLDRYTLQLKIVRNLVLISAATLIVFALGISGGVP